MITTLNEYQESQLEVYQNKWIDIGLSTNEVDVEKSLASLRKAYEQVNLTFPEKYEVYDSPFEAITEMKIRYNIDITPNNFIYGAQDATWLSFYNYFLEVVDVKECEMLIPFMDLAESCGWALLFDELVVLTHNPLYIKFDDQNQTHCEDDYAIKYRDGTGVASWHGVKVPPEWIFDKQSITPEICLSWNNIEQRRCACEIVGWAKVLDNLDAVIIDKDVDETVGTLLEVNLPDVGKEKFLVVLDPNVNRKVGIPVPQEMKTALEANSWTYGIDKFEFVPEFRV